MLQQCFRVPIFIPARNPQHAPEEAGVVVAAGIPGFDQALVAEIPAVQRGAAGFPAFDHEFGFGDGRRFDPRYVNNSNRNRDLFMKKSSKKDLTKSGQCASEKTRETAGSRQLPANERVTGIRRSVRWNRSWISPFRRFRATPAPSRSGTASGIRRGAHKRRSAPCGRAARVWPSRSGSRG